MIMKDKLEELLNEIEERMNFYIKRLDNPQYAEMQGSFIGHYLELKDIKEKVEDILYENDGQVHR